MGSVGGAGGAAAAWIVSAAIVCVFGASALAQPKADEPARADPTKADRTMSDLAHRHFLQKDYARAEALYVRALAMREQRLGKHHVEIATMLHNLAEIYKARRDYARAERALKRSLAIRKRNGIVDDLNVAATLNTLALVYLARGQYARVEPLWLRVLAIQERKLGQYHRDVVTTLDYLALLYAMQGRVGLAQPRAARAVAIKERRLGKNHLELAGSLSSLAYLYAAGGQRARAERLHLRVLAIRRAKLPPNHADIAKSLYSLGRLYVAQHDYKRAERYYEQALAIREASLGKNHRGVAVVLTALAHIYQMRGDHAAAEPLLSRALAIMENTSGKDHPDVALPLGGLARLYMVQRRYNRAEALMLRALRLTQKYPGKDHPNVAGRLVSLGILYQVQRKYSRAEAMYTRALALQKSKLGEDNPALATTLGYLAMLHQERGRHLRALPLMARAAAIREGQLSLNLAMGTEARMRAFMDVVAGETRAILSLHAQYAPQHPRAMRLGLETLLRRKGRVLDESAAAIAALRRRGSPVIRKLLNELAWKRSALAKLVFGRVGADVRRHRKRLNAAKAAVQKIEDELARHSPMLASAKTPVTIPRIQAALSAGEALVELAWYRPIHTRKRGSERTGPPRYVAYVLRKRGAPRWVDLGEAAAIERVVKNARAAFADPRSNPRAAGRALYRALIAPLKPLWGDARRIIVSPDGAISLVPLAAAIDPRGRYLLETHSVHYVTSGRELLRRRVTPDPGGAPVIIADPAFGRATSGAHPMAQKRSGDLGAAQFTRLPGTRAEGLELERLLSGARVLLGAAATESAVKKLAGPTVLHLATHGFFLSDQTGSRSGERGLVAGPSSRTRAVSKEDPLLRSGLALAGANVKRSGSDDGILTAEEAKGLDLAGTRLVVLSACDTGVGQVRNGQGVYGLRRALMLAGAETLVMSLWKVDDSVTKRLMVAYYRRLFAGDGRAEALRVVQRAMLRDPATAHPSYWAGFIVSGNPRTLAGRPARLPRVRPSSRGCACDAARDAPAGGSVLLVLLCALVLCVRRPKGNAVS